MRPPSRAADLADRLHSQAIHLLRWLRREDEAAGLTAPQLSALSVIVHAGPVTLGELAAAEQVRPPTITRLVSQLEADGLVIRSRSTADRRVVRVEATFAGRSRLEDGRWRRVAALTNRLEELETGELRTLESATDVLQLILNERVRR